MNRTALLVVGVLASAAILISTGAVPLENTGTDEIPDADIEMRPVDGPNGDYAVLNGDNEIELLLTDANPYIEAEGISDDTVANLDGVFTINYTGNEQAEVWITDDAEDVHFFQGTDPGDGIEGEDDSIVLFPDERVRVGLHVDTRGEDDVESAEEFTVHARVPDAQEVDGGGGADVGPGPGSGTDDAGGGSGDGSDGGFTAEATALSISSANLSAQIVDPGEPVTVTAVVENPTTMNATVWAPLLVDGRAVTGAEMTIPPNETRVVAFDVAFDTPGRYHLEVEAHAEQSVIESASASAGSLQVRTPDTGTPTGTATETPTDTTGTPIETATNTPTETETPVGPPTATETPTATPTPPTPTPTPTAVNGTGVNVIDVRTPTGPANGSSQGPLLAVEEPLGIAPWSMLAVLSMLAITVIALRAWRSRGGAL